MINEISDYLYTYKNITMEASVIAKDCEESISSFANKIKEENLDLEVEENFLTILGYSFRLADIKQQLFFTFQEAVYAIDLDKLMRNEDSLKLNSIVYILVLDVLIKDFNGSAIESSLKDKAVSTYKLIEDRKAKENKKYHMYQN